MTDFSIHKQLLDNRTGSFSEENLSATDKTIIDNWTKQHNARAKYASSIFKVEGSSLTESDIVALINELKAHTQKDGVEFDRE